MPKDLKSTKELAYRDFLDKMLGDKSRPEGDDQIQVSDSPIDYLPYAKLLPVAKAAGGALADGVAHSLDSVDKFARLKGIVGNNVGSVGKEIFDPNNAKHLNILKPVLEKNLPASIDNTYADGEMLHELLKDKARQPTLLDHPDIKNAISDAGFKDASKKVDDASFDALKNKLGY